MPSSVVPRPQRAVVVGGSLAGLCVARVLADRVEQVTVVERDRYPDAPRPRKGVPQAHHLHVLVTAGQRALERLFPGLLADLEAAGAVRMGVPTDTLYLTPTGWRERGPVSHQLVGASRELIDWVARSRLRTDGRVRFVQSHDVVGFLPSADGRSVGGVTLRARPARTPGSDPAAAGADEVASAGEDRLTRLDADLVVDASGRHSRTSDWLDALGHGRPEETVIDAGLAYASRRYRLSAELPHGAKSMLLMPDPPTTSTAGILYPIENGQWVVTLGGVGESRPPTDESGFLEFARALRSPILYEAIRDAEPVSPIHGFRQTANHRRNYHTMPRRPANLLVVGDAACTFNPVYGHGMSVAACTAVALDEHLRAHQDGLGPDAQAVIAGCSTQAWRIGTGADLRYASTTGPRPASRGRLSRWYLDRAADVANRDAYVAAAFTDVMHLVAPPSAMTRPGVALRVLRGRPGPVLTTPPPAPRP